MEYLTLADVGFSRIIEVEKKIDSIYSLLQTGPQGSRPANGAALRVPELPTPQSLPSPESVGNESGSCSHQESTSNAFDMGDLSQFSADAPGTMDVIQKGIISLKKAEDLLNAVTSEYGSFHWLIFPSGLSLNIYRRERPFLLLALLALASRKQRRLYEPLQDEFKNVLSAKVIMNGTPNVDILQGLLVYLAWYHLHPGVPPQKMYMLAQIAVAMSADLHIPSLIVDESNSQWKAELERMYLQVYCMSSCDSMVFRKPISMRYDDFAGRCCRSLAEKNVAPTDADLIHFIGLQRLAEEIASTFAYDSPHIERTRLGLETIELSIKAFSSRIQELRRSFPSDSLCLPSLLLAYENTRIYLYEVSLYMEPTTTRGSALPFRGAEDFSQRRITLLLSCLEATKSFLDYFLQLPADMVTKHSTQERGYLAHATMVLMKLAFCSNLGIENFSLREACNVLYYVDSLPLQLGDLDDEYLDDGQPDSFVSCKIMAERVKSWYERTEFYEQTGTPSDLKDMSPLQFVTIAKEEQLMNFDFTTMDFSFYEGLSF